MATDATEGTAARRGTNATVEGGRRRRAPMPMNTPTPPMDAGANDGSGEAPRYITIQHTSGTDDNEVAAASMLTRSPMAAANANE